MIWKAIDEYNFYSSYLWLIVGYILSIACGIPVEWFMNFLQSRSEVLKAEKSNLKRTLIKELQWGFLVT